MADLAFHPHHSLCVCGHCASSHNGMDDAHNGMDDTCAAPTCPCQRFAFTPIEDTGSRQDPEPSSKEPGDEFYAYRQQAVAGESRLIKLANDLAAERDALLVTLKSRDQQIKELGAGDALEVGDEPMYLSKCASCGGQFPTFRDICSECEDDAEDDGYRDGKKRPLEQTP